MEEKLRKTGIDVIGEVPWGTHFCQFYQTKEDMIDILVPYFKAGLENNEFCMWVTSEPLEEKEANKALKKAVPNLNRYLQKGQIEILPYEEWYLKEGFFDLQRVLNDWVVKLDQALVQGYEGMRVTGNTAWLEKKDWNDFTDYEEEVNKVIGRYRMMAICTYALDKCGPHEVIDVVGNHQFAIIRRSGRWELIESSERKLREEMLQESEAKYRSLVESTEDSVYVVDKDCSYIYMNKKNLSRLGLPSDKVVGRSYDDFHSKEGSEKFKKRINRVFRTRRSQTHEYRSERDGKYFLRTYSPIKGAEGKIEGVTVISKDISTLKKAEVKIRNSEKLYKGLVENAGIAILMDDREGNFTYSNSIFAKMFGYSINEMKTQSIRTILHPDDVSIVRMNHEKRIQEKKAPCRYEFRGVKKDGSVGYFEVVAEVLKDDGKIVGTCSYIWEITERKQAEEAIKQHQSDLKRLSIKLVSSLEAERKRISQELHDEVGQALTAVKINLSVISPMLQSGAAPRVRERLAETIDLTEDLLEKIQDLSLSLRPSMLDDLGLVPALRWYIDSFEKRTKIKTRLQILNVKERFRPEIETSLFRIVQEALTNAVKYAKADLITIYLKKKKSEIELSIVDNGEGFDLEEFRSRPFSDRGIGLIGIQERAASHNGAAQIHTQTNQGTKIIISIPREVRAWTP